MPKIGQIEDGYQFKGGDPSKPENWTPVQPQEDPYKDVMMRPPTPMQAPFGGGAIPIPSELRKSEVFKDRPYGPGMGGYMNVLKGATFGYGDEILAKTISSISDEPYEKVLANLRGQQKVYQEETPVPATALQLGGGLAVGGPAMKLLPKRIADLPPILKWPAIGGGFGALQGSGEAEEDRGMGALKGGLLGGAFGLALPVAGALVRKPAEFIAKQFRAPETEAQKLVVNALQRDQITPQQAVQEMQRLGPQSTLADISPNIRALAGAVAERPGPVMQRAEQMLETRSRSMAPRIVGELRKLTGNDKEAFGTYNQIITRRAAQSKPYYDDAMTQAVPTESMQRVIRGLDDLVTGQEGTKIAKAVESFKRQLIDKKGQPVTTIRQIDGIKKDLDDKISTLYRQGQKERAGILQQAKRALLAEVDQAVPSYATARQIFSNETKVLDSLKLGRNILSDDFEVMAARIESMSKAESEAFITGAIKTIRDKLLNTGIGNNAARKLSAPIIREKLSNIFPDEQSFNQFMKQIDAEEIFQMTRAAATKGSQTHARREAEKALASETETSLGNYARGVIGDLLGTQEKTLEQAGKILYTQGPAGQRMVQELEKVLPNMTPEQKQEIMKLFMMMSGQQIGAQ